jgi:hypothetical protein
MTIRSGRSTSADYVSKPRPQGHVADHVGKGHVADSKGHISDKGHIWQTTSAKDICGRPCQQGHESSDLKDHFGCILIRRSTPVEG